MTASSPKSPRTHILRTILASLATLGVTADATADVLVFVCAGKESMYTETFEEHQENLINRSATVRLEIDPQKKTMSLSGTTKADGRGALQSTPASFDTSYSRTMVIYEVRYKHVLVHLPQTRNELTVIAGTHLDLSAPDAEARLLFSGICRLPRKS